MKCATCQNHTSRRICQACETATGKNLYRIPELHMQLSRDTWAKTPKRTESERPARAATTGAPADLHVISLLDRRTDARAELTPHLHAISQLMDATPPQTLNITELCTRLQIVLPWAVEHYPDIGTLVRTARTQTTLLHNAIEGTPPPARRVPCPVIHPETGACTGTLKMDADATITCRACQSSWEYENWTRLGRLFAQ